MEKVLFVINFVNGGMQVAFVKSNEAEKFAKELSVDPLVRKYERFDRYSFM